MINLDKEKFQVCIDGDYRLYTLEEACKLDNPEGRAFIKVTPTLLLKILTGQFEPDSKH